MVEGKNIKVGWIGTGVMGRYMAGHIMTKGNLKISVYNRTASKADPLVQEGAEFKSAVEIAKEADYLFLMLGYPHDVENMVLDKDQGILQHMKPGSYLIDWVNLSIITQRRIPIPVVVSTLDHNHMPLYCWVFFNVYPTKFSTSGLHAQEAGILVEEIDKLKSQKKESFDNFFYLQKQLMIVNKWVSFT